MRRPDGLRGLAIALCACAAALLLAACGSSTKTVTVANPPPVSQTTATTQPSETTSTATQTTPTQTSSTGTTTRTAPEPAFTKQESNVEGLSAASATVRAHGYTPNDTAEYDPQQTLRVLVGTQAGSSDGYGQQAFFFVSGHYLGTDTKLPSATVKVVSQGDTEVTLSYPLYRKGDALSSPSGGQTHVTFELNNGKLVAMGKIPPAESSTGLSRN
jgi:cytoskeletal protein RodZ